MREGYTLPANGTIIAKGQIAALIQEAPGQYITFQAVNALEEPHSVNLVNTTFFATSKIGLNAFPWYCLYVAIKYIYAIATRRFAALSHVPVKSKEK